MSDLHTPDLSHPPMARRSTVIDDTASHTFNPGAGKVQVISDTTIASLTAPSKTDANGLVGVVIPAGTEIIGPITQIQLTSGLVEAHISY